MCQHCNFKTTRRVKGYLRAMDIHYAQAVAGYAVEHFLKDKTFDAVAYSGHSGALVAPLIAGLMSKDLILVRKSDDDSHSDNSVEASRRGVKSYIIVDDFMSSGRTVERIAKSVRYYLPRAKLVGIYEYMCNSYLSGVKNNSAWYDVNTSASIWNRRGLDEDCCSVIRQYLKQPSGRKVKY